MKAYEIATIALACSGVFFIFVVYASVTAEDRNRDYLKEHHCVHDKNTPAVGTKDYVKELYLCEKDGPRGRRVWVSQ